MIEDDGDHQQPAGSYRSYQGDLNDPSAVHPERGEPGDIRPSRRAAWTAARAHARARRRDRVVGFVRWGAKYWILPFDDLARARDFFARADGIGIDYDYGAYFDASDPDRLILSWERLGGPPGDATLTQGEHMTDLIGRGGRGGGGGGGFHGGHGGGGFRGGGRGRGRRNFGGGGGWGGWWPGYYPYGYGYPWPYGYPVQGDGSGEDAEGADEVESSGALALAGSSGNELIDLLPALSPGAGGLSCRTELGPDLVLRVSICVDGRCYRTAADLSEILSGIAEGVSALHARLHGAHDVADAIEVGRIHRHQQGQHPHRRHHHHHRRRQDQDEDRRDQDQDQDRGRDRDQDGALLAPGPRPSTTLDPVLADQITKAAQAAAVAAVAQMAAQSSSAVADDARRVRRDGRAPEESPQAVKAVGDQGGAAVKAAGEILIGALYDQHLNAVGVGGFWDSVKDSLGDVARAAATPFTWLNKNVAKGLKQLEPAVTIAATAVATSYGGPAAGAAAKQLTGPILDVTAKTGGDPTKLFDQARAQAHHQTGGDPQVAQAMDAARSAIAHTAAAYHLTTTASKAAAGDPHAASKIAELEGAATGGDQGAIQAMRIIAQGLAAKLGQGDAISGADGGGAEERARERELRREGAAAATVLHREGWSRYVGFAKTRGGRQVQGSHGSAITMDDSSVVVPFPSIDQAYDWLGSLGQDDLVYAAYYDAADPTFPTPLNETFGRRTTTHVSGGAQITARPRMIRPRDMRRERGWGDLADQDRDGQADWIRQFALSSAQRMREERGEGEAVVVVLSPTHGQHTIPFDTREQAMSWLRHADRRAMSYVAVVDVSDPGYPVMLEERWASPETHAGAAGILPWLALAAAGGAGWTGHAWWKDRQARLAAESAAKAATHPAAPAALPGGHPATISGAAGLFPWLMLTPPWLALSAAGAAGWFASNWWRERQARP